MTDVHDSATSAPGACLRSMYRQMVLIREFEDTVQQLFQRGLVSGTTHLCTGQEAVAVGVAAAMREDDYSTYTYRGHGHVLARGLDPEAAFAEMMGRSGGVNRGKGGSMHLTDARLGLMGSFAIVGAGLPVAVGLGRAAQLRDSGQVSVTFFGEGTTNIGAFHESLNLAAVWRAPVVFVCENNLYGEYTRYNLSTPVEDMAVRATSYAMPSAIVDGNDVTVVRAAAAEAIDRARHGGGPTFLECKTYRQRGHSRSDPGTAYRPDEERAAWQDRDPLKLARRQLLTQDGLTAEDLARIDAEIARQVQDAAERASQSPFPHLTEVTSNVYC